MIRLKTVLRLGGFLVLCAGCSTSAPIASPSDAMAVDLDDTVAKDMHRHSVDLSLTMPDIQEVGASSDAGATSVDAEPMPTWTPSGPPDLVLNQELLGADVWFDEIEVDAFSCAFLEGCVDGVGRRRIMRFAVATGNVGAEDLVLGDISQLTNEAEYSPCHKHYHYTDYADYRLLQGDAVVRRGHKQAFCLMDTRPMNGVDRDAIGARALYNCRFQGISAGWEDVYGSALDCQWIDITDLSAGTYQLAVEINPLGVLKEHRDDNNDGEISVNVPTLDLTQPCYGDVRPGLKSACGWLLNERIDCEPGRLVRVGGGGCYELGTCSGSHVLRACDAALGACSSGLALAEADEGCAGNACPYLEFQCPLSGAAHIWTLQPISPEQTMTVTVDHTKVQLGRACTGDTPRGLGRLCGWAPRSEQYDCLPGRMYRVGCDDVGFDCEKPPRCDGDPMLRVCNALGSCTANEALAQDDDACGTRCPMDSFQCPVSGAVQVWKGAYDANETFSCAVQLVLLPDH